MATESNIDPSAHVLKSFKVTGKLNKDCVFSKIVTCMNKAEAWQQTKQDINKISQLLHISIDEVA